MLQMKEKLDLWFSFDIVYDAFVGCVLQWYMFDISQYKISEWLANDKLVLWIVNILWC